MVLERPGTDRHPAPGRDLTPVADVLRPPPVRTPAESGARPRFRSLPHPPGRRAHLWLAALVAGAVLAAVPGVSGRPDGMTGTASDYGLGGAADLAASGGIDDAGVRRSITEAEAQVRLGELAASRAARAPKTVLPTQGRLTTCYCMRWGQMHYGLDLAAPWALRSTRPPTASCSGPGAHRASATPSTSRTRTAMSTSTATCGTTTWPPATSCTPGTRSRRSAARATPPARTSTTRSTAASWTAVRWTRRTGSPSTASRSSPGRAVARMSTRPRGVTGGHVRTTAGRRSLQLDERGVAQDQPLGAA